MVSLGVRFLASAAAISLLVGVGPVRVAAANDFTDSCAAGGGGMFEAKDCGCLDGKVTAAADRTALIDYFKLNAAVMKGSAPTSNDASAKMQKGTELIGKYLGECMK